MEISDIINRKYIDNMDLNDIKDEIRIIENAMEGKDPQNNSGRYVA